MELRECCDCEEKYDAQDAFKHKVWDNELLCHITEDRCPSCLHPDYYVNQ